MRFRLMLFFAFSFHTAYSQTVPDSLKANWSLAGLQGPIPDYSTIVDVTAFGAIANDTLDDQPSVVAAISALNGNAGVVFFPAGSYVFHSSINLSDSIILRGEGSDASILLFDFNNATSNSINVSASNAQSFVTINNGYSKGSIQIIVPGGDSLFNPGDEIEIREENGSWDTNPAPWAEYSVGHLSQLDSVNGDTLWLKEALRIDFNASQNPSIRKISQRKSCGLECFKMKRVDGNAPSVNYGVNFSFAKNCWMSGVESETSIGAHVAIEMSSHIKISGCYFHEAYLYDGASTHGYGVMMIAHSCANLVEDNIFKMLRHAMIIKQGANGNVYGYNYSREPIRSEPIADFAADICLHGHYAFANLFEGNISQNLQIDQAWGPSGPYNMFFRNLIELYGIIMSSGAVQSDRQTFVGNDVSNTTLLHGLYTLEGSGHFEYGNNVRGNIVPNGTGNLPDTSCFIDTFPPYFWNIVPTLPSIGIPNTYAMDINPARQRYLDGGLLTRCYDEPDTTVNFIPEIPDINSFSIVNTFINESALIIELFTEVEQAATIKLFSVSGMELINQKLLLEKGLMKLHVSLSSGLPSGIYFINIKTSQKESTRKIALVK